jgi:hypothetical protein
MALGERALAQRHRKMAIDETRDAATRAAPAMLTAYANALALYLSDGTAADRRAQTAEMNRVWAELQAAGLAEIMDMVRENAPWWQPPDAR